MKIRQELKEFLQSFFEVEKVINRNFSYSKEKGSVLYYSYSDNVSYDQALMERTHNITGTISIGSDYESLTESFLLDKYQLKTSKEDYINLIGFSLFSDITKEDYTVAGDSFVAITHNFKAQIKENWNPNRQEMTSLGSVSFIFV
jgi:regulatory protein YycI of two-component signal transduction system YycFG